MPRKQRRPFNIEQKAQAVVRHLQDNVPVSTLCDELDIHPNQFYDWQKQAMANLSAAFKKESNAEIKNLYAEIARFKERLAKKDEAIAELLEEYITVKKKIGVI